MIVDTVGKPVIVDVGSLLPALREIAATLGEAATEADRKLSAVGGGLAGVVEILGGLTRRFELLPNELESEPLREGAGGLGKVAREIAAMAVALVAERAALAGLSELNRHMGVRIAKLRKTINAISMLAVNAQIEAAHIDIRGDDFTSFAKEIVRLARTAGVTAESYAREHDKLTALLRAACEAQADFFGAREETLRSAGRQLEASLRTVEARRARAAAAVVEIGRRSKRIAEEIGCAVMALQIGDITRQRLEHVGEVLAMLAAGLEPQSTKPKTAGSWSLPLGDGEKAAVAAVICRMQSVQASEAAAEFEREVGRVVASLAQLAGEASAIVRFGNGLYGAAERNDGSFLEELQEQLSLARGLVRECGTARGRVDRVISSVAESLDDLLARVKSIRTMEIDMRLLGLNTTLKCGRLGDEGRTLSVVAHELRGLANQTVQDADALLSALEDVTSAVRRFAEDGRQRDASRMAVLEQEMTVSLAPFEECGGRLAHALAALAEQGESASGTLRESASGIAAHDDVGSILKAASQRVAGMAEAVAAGEIEPSLMRECLAIFADGRYTMASEREVHARFVPDLVEVVPDAARGPAPPTESSLEDILF